MRKARKRRKPANDCLRQCVARLLGRPVHRVPHFVRKYGGRWAYYLARWCERIGYAVIDIVKTRGCMVVASEAIRAWILIGPSSRKAKRPNYHAILMRARPNQPAVVEWDGGIPLRRATRTLYIVPKPRPE